MIRSDLINSCHKIAFENFNVNYQVQTKLAPKKNITYYWLSKPETMKGQV